ncbi:MAG: TolC family protein [Planctomycetes bacterium]|nr:TolC family protein [Planctomycetota bacterium]
MPRFLATVLCLAAATLCAAQEPPADTPPEPPKDPRPRVRYTLDDCLRLASENNLDLAYARLEPGLYEGDLIAFRGAYDPTAYITFNRRSIKAPTASALSGAPILDEDLWSGTAGVKGGIVSGATYDFNFQTERDFTNSSFSTLNPKWSSSYGVSLRQPLLKAAWVDYNLVSARLSRNSHRQSIFKVEETASTTLYNVEFAYWTLVNSIRQRDVKQRALELAQRLYEVNRNKVRAGALAPIEELRAESEVASQKEGIILAENTIEDSQDELKRLIRPFNAPADWDFVIEPADEPAFEATAVDPEAAISRALENRPELEQLRIAMESAKINEWKYGRDLLPTVDLTGSLRYSGLGRNFGDSLEGIRTSDFDTWEVGIVIEYPFGTRAARGGLARAEAERRRADLSLRNTEQTVVLEVREAAREINTTAQRIEATKTAVRLARRSLEAEQARYDRGLTTSHELLQFQKTLTEAESNETKAVIDHNIARLKLRKSTGTLLTERAGR